MWRDRTARRLAFIEARVSTRPLDTLSKMGGYRVYFPISAVRTFYGTRCTYKYGKSLFCAQISSTFDDPYS
jgi:hypothetical protein